MRPSLLRLGLAAVLIMAPLVVTYQDYFTTADACLEYGGSFDYRAWRCDQKENHPRIAYSELHPRIVPMTVAAEMLLLVSGLVWWWRSRARAA
jgi:hypothetical protein